MNTSWISSVLISCLLICIVQSASASRERRGIITSNFLRDLADRIDIYNEWVELNDLDNHNQLQQEKRGCDVFGGCAQLKVGRELAIDTLQKGSGGMFGSSGPGRKRRSTQSNDVNV
ncbi:uncharacterized protein [Antedon mediterranea]|uniref:uncharacterized protein isoform X2 n=1 Tax=Antedon mediterranea TaxID=105859 RepID=UPI003AF6B6CA